MLGFALVKPILEAIPHAINYYAKWKPVNKVTELDNAIERLSRDPSPDDILRIDQYKKERNRIRKYFGVE